MLIRGKQIGGFFSSIRNKNKKLQTKIYRVQRKIADYIKRHRTIKLLHLFRKYSAFAVVISSAALVTATNMAAEGQTGLLSGQWKESSGVKADMNIQAEKDMQSDLAPVSVASRAVDPKLKDNKQNEIIGSVSNNIITASSSPVLKDPQEDGGVEIYTVRDGDTVSSIAVTHHITVNTILWANDIENIDSIMPGDKIFILPVAGLSYVVKKGETLDKIAKKYKADREKIIAFNNLPANGDIKEGQEIVIPGGQKEVPAPEGVSVRTGISRRSYATPSGGTPRVSGWKKLEGKAGKGHKFPYGYCTWYVAQKRYVPWGGNAGTWLYHAKSRGYKTGKVPRKGAIMVSSESWWGHVAVVEKVGKGTITVSEMNYRGWAKVSRRTISTKSRAIKGYIY